VNLSGIIGANEQGNGVAMILEGLVPGADYQLVPKKAKTLILRADAI
jgi:hypothetical protein